VTVHSLVAEAVDEMLMIRARKHQPAAAADAARYELMDDTMEQRHAPDVVSAPARTLSAPPLSTSTPRRTV